MSKLSELTSMRVGGEPAELKVCETREQLIETTKKVWASGEDWLLIGGGTNMVVSESIEDLSVIQIKTKGIEKTTFGDKQIWRIQAGEDWDELVAASVNEGLAGIEAMSGIPGSVGASPVQNIGAYGQELSDVFLKAEFLDYESGELEILEPKDMKFGYRDRKNWTYHLDRNRTSRSCRQSQTAVFRSNCKRSQLRNGSSAKLASGSGFSSKTPRFKIDGARPKGSKQCELWELFY
jgi:UDP-N-acetylenolpyruvoylglucosamine reductase